MIPTKRLDISWFHLAYGLTSCLFSGGVSSFKKTSKRIESFWDKAEKKSIVCLSVRTGFDLLLETLKLPKNSEILVSAITIPGMIQIMKHHELLPVPIDINPKTLSVSVAEIEKQITPKTKIILVAHLFGSRMKMDEIVKLAQSRNLLLIEDCAQAFDGTNYYGHEKSDAVMFSFGSLKTATALGCALFTLRDDSLLQKMRSQQEKYPVQNKLYFVRRVSKYGLLKLLTTPFIFNIFCFFCRLARSNTSEFLYKATRGFSEESFFLKIRQQPSAGQLKLLEYRLKHYSSRKMKQRIELGYQVLRELEKLCVQCCPGVQTKNHTFWVFPFIHNHSKELVQFLWNRGFDCTPSTSSLSVVSPPDSRPECLPKQAQQMMENLVYLPVYPEVSYKKICALQALILEFIALKKQSNPQG